MLDFTSLKAIRIVEVVSVRYKVSLRFRGDFANCPCPLPTHKDGDKSKSFSICLSGNYFRCFSESCNAANGGKKGGDVISFVAIMENCSNLEAARKLFEWFGAKEKGASRIETRPLPTTDKKDYQYDTKSSDSVKYTARVALWFEELWKRKEGETDEAYYKRCLKGVTTQLIENYKFGKAGKVL